MYHIIIIHIYSCVFTVTPPPHHWAVGTGPVVLSQRRGSVNVQLLSFPTRPSSHMGNRWLQVVTGGYRRLWVVIGGYGRLLEVICYIMLCVGVVYRCCVWVLCMGVVYRWLLEVIGVGCVKVFCIDCGVDFLWRQSF